MDEAINHPSSKGIEGASLSHDGLRFYFGMERDGGYGSLDVWVCERESAHAPWGKAMNLGPNINGPVSQQEPAISNDELELCFWVVDRSSGAPWEWHFMRSTRTSKDEPWGPAAEYTGFYPDDFSSDGLTMYFTVRWSLSGGYGEGDIWRLVRASTEEDWGDPINLGPNVNDERRQGNACISYDDLALFFNEDDSQLMKMSVRRTRDGDWGPAVDISATLCPEHQKRYNPELSPDGRVLYFVSHDFGAFTERKVWQASIMPKVDFNGDGMVDLVDLDLMTAHQGTDHSFYDVGPMPWGDGVVDDADVEVVATFIGQAVDYPVDHVFDVTPVHNPEPADGWTTDVEKALPLSWTPGDKATVHELYFGTDRAAVERADVSDRTGIYRGPQYHNSYTPWEGVQANQTYYWRLDEFKGTATSKGGVWSFTVADLPDLPDSFVVDDFENYIAEGNMLNPRQIWHTWWDGWEDPENGSQVGYAEPPFVEMTIVHGGLQSMPFIYDNSNAPISRTFREWPDPQDWTVRGVQVLTLWFYGEPDNAADPFYVGLEDSAGKRKDITHPDPAALTVNDWRQWSIPLTDFTDVDPTAIKVMYIGTGDPAGSQPGGSGLVRIDDIELHRSSGQ
jgi:hypothetical protein